MNAGFRDRVEAGQQLAPLLSRYARRDDVIVLGLPRGGVPVAFEIACRLHVPLDVLIVRKLGAPGREELALGAIAMGGVEVHDDSLLRAFHVSPAQFDGLVGRERAELDRRNRRYRGSRPFPNLAGMIVILVDDGIATGSTMLAAVRAARKSRARSVVVAAPVSSAEAAATLRREADEVVALLIPDELYAIGAFYGDFAPTSDDEVTTLLERATIRLGAKTAGT